jgi:hypothetical protein
MATDGDFYSAPTVAGLFVAGLSLGAVYAFNYARLGQMLGVPKDASTARPSTSPSVDGADGAGDVRAEKEGEAKSAASTTRKGRRKRRGRGEGVGEGEGEGGGGGKGKGGGGGEVEVEADDGAEGIVPGDFEGVGVGVGAGVDVGSQEASPAGTASKQGNTQGKKKTKKNQKQGKGKNEDRDQGQGQEAGSETGKEVEVGRTVPRRRPRSGDSTDASVSLSPSVSGDALTSSHAMAKGNLRARTRLPSLSQPHAQARAHVPSHPREVRPSLSLDTDSSWTHVDHRSLQTSRSTDGQARGLADAMDVTSSDLASTASDSPVAERMDNVTTDMRGARARLVQRPLADKRIPRPKETGVDEYVFIFLFARCSLRLSVYIINNSSLARIPSRALPSHLPYMVRVADLEFFFSL